MRRALMAAALIASPCVAQQREMATDRPNQTNTPTTIEPGRVQFEIAAFDTTLDRDGADARTRTWSLGEVNARIGVTDRLEVNVVVPAHAVAHERGARYVRGVGDVTLGAKLNLRGNDGEGDGLAIQPQVSLPTARAGLGTRLVEVVVAVPYTHDLPAGFGLSLQPGAAWLASADETRHVAAWQLAAALDHDVGPANVYLEYLAIDTAERGAPARHQLDVGGTLALGRNLVLDAGTEIGLSEGADDIRLLTGLSVRF